MDEYGDPCDHIQHHGLRRCPGLTAKERAFGEKVHSVGIHFAHGRDVFHGDYGTTKEQEREIFANAKKYGNEPPEYIGPQSKSRPLSELKAELKPQKEEYRAAPRSGIDIKIGY
jgi:hypothetical protein